MTHRITIRPKASIDTDECFDYIREKDEEAAMRFFDAIRETFANLARMPRMGKRYGRGPESASPLRQWPVKGFRSYLIFYRVYAAEIEIIRILPASRDLTQLLKDELS
jgi:toxin ParE1/3/4